MMTDRTSKTVFDSQCLIRYRLYYLEKSQNLRSQIMKKVEILDTTLRDGSYAINFAFTSALTSTLCRELEEAGFNYIEIGHGVGLGSTRKGLNPAFESDASYLDAAKKALKKAKFGMFCIPGVADLEDVDLAGDHGMSFIRVGTDVTRVPDSEKFIKKAKSYNMVVAANYMKSYSMPPKAFAEQVLRSQDYGADIVYIVDSAGGMFYEDIQKYFDAVKQVSNIKIGFHGHNNLGLAVSNSLAAAQAGFDFVDSSLQGLGRSAGNASTEMLVTALVKAGFDTGIDFLRTLKIGLKYIQPMLPSAGIMPLDVVAGYAEFHSSYMPQILKAASKYEVDPAALIIEVCKVDRVNCKETLLNEIGQKLQMANKKYEISDFGFHSYIGGEQDSR
jgi:4-hydroxy-2-oxovalerate aldolase